jgi:putative Holliday junction resolvase
MSPGRRFLGVDFGTVRVGLAVGDEAGTIASPLMTYVRRGRNVDATFFRHIVAEQDVGRIIVGLPVHLSGREGKKSVEARTFGRWLIETTGIEVVYWDERFTTVEAESALWAAGLTHKRRKAKRDRVAAQMMLQSYLDAGCPTDPIAWPLDE